jgi:hypothetical protein
MFPVKKLDNEHPKTRAHHELFHFFKQKDTSFNFNFKKKEKGSKHVTMKINGVFLCLFAAYLQTATSFVVPSSRTKVCDRPSDALYLAFYWSVEQTHFLTCCPCALNRALPLSCVLAMNMTIF